MLPLFPMPSAPVDDDFESSSEDFFSEYAARVARARAALERGEPPTLLRVEDSLVLRVDRRKWRVKLVGEAYDSLMRACHLPSAMALLHEPEQPFPPHLSRYAAQLHADRQADPRARELVKRCIELLEGPAMERWEQAMKILRDPMHRCIERAAALELERLHAATTELVQRCGDQREALRFVVCAGHQPRYRQLTKMYFQRITGERDDGANRSERRVVYAESRTEAEALQLLAAQRVDVALAHRIWKDPQRMQQDVLGDAAVAALDRLDPPRL